MNPQRSPSCARAFGKLASLLCSLLLAPAAWSQTTPRILHEGVECMLSGQHLILQALVEPADQLVTVKAYFRAELYPAFFYVEMTRSGDRYQGVLPRPTRETETVVYYLEAVDSAFNSLRTEEFRPRVVLDANDCQEDGPPPSYLEGPANIAVGSTTAGSSFPPGFLTEGIVATITTAGRAVVSGGAGAGTFIAVGAAAGAAAGVGLLVGSGDDTTTTSVTSGVVTTTAPPTTTSPPTTTAPAGALTACFETQPNPPTIPVGGTVRFDASCSGPEREQIVTYSWTFGDGRDSKEGRVVTRVYSDAGVFTAELTIADALGNRARTSKDVRVELVTSPGPGPGPGPGPTTTVPGSADLAITSLSGPPATNVSVTAGYTVGYANNGPNLDPTVTLVTTFNASGAGGAPVLISAPGCGSSSGGGSLTVSCFVGSLGPGGSGSRTISVQYPSIDTYFISTSISGGTSDPVPGNNGGNLSTAVSLKAGRALETAFLSEIETPVPGDVRASLELNRSEIATTDDSGPKRHVMQAQRGQNVLAGYAVGTGLDGALWKLDFSATEGLVPGSVVVEAGDVVSAGGPVMVFRLGGGEARIRLRFRLE